MGCAAVPNLKTTDSQPFSLKRLEAFWLLKLLQVKDLPSIAVEAMTQGWESESLLQIACCEQDESEALQQLFPKALVELGGGTMSVRDALKFYAREISLKILSSEMSPQVGANMISDVTAKVADEDFHDLDGFIYAASEMPDRPGEEDFFEKAIVEEAKSLVR